MERHEVAQSESTMKKLTLPILAIIAVGAWNTAAADTLHSPRAQEKQVNNVQIQARATGGRADRPIVVTTSPRLTEQRAQRSFVHSADRHSAARTTAGPVGPRFQTPRASEQFYVAPLK